MTDTEDERQDPSIPYGGDYQLAENFEAPQVRPSRALGGYSELEDLASDGGALGLSSSDVVRVETVLTQMTASEKRNLSRAVGAYLGDVLCSMHPGVWWESVDVDTPIVRLSPKITWDVFAYVEGRIKDTPDLVSTGLAEMERLLSQKI